MERLFRRRDGAGPRPDRRGLERMARGNLAPGRRRDARSSWARRPFRRPPRPRSASRSPRDGGFDLDRLRAMYVDGVLVENHAPSPTGPKTYGRRWDPSLGSCQARHSRLRAAGRRSIREATQFSRGYIGRPSGRPVSRLSRRLAPSGRLPAGRWARRQGDRRRHQRAHADGVAGQADAGPAGGDMELRHARFRDLSGLPPRN